RRRTSRRPVVTRLVRAIRVTTSSLLAFAIVVAATGWLYLIQPHSRLPGPPLPDALPLDELSKHSAVPIVVFLAVWVTAALLLGLVARVARAERLTAGLLLALGVGGWTYLVTGVSLLIVRQIPAEQAFRAAARGLARRKRRAWQIAVALLCLLVVLHLQHGFGYGAIGTLLVALALVARRTDFDALGDPESHPRVLLQAALFAAAIVGYAFA